MYTKEYEELFEKKERARKELEELEEKIARTGIGPEDDWELREEYNDKSLAYAYASIALDEYLNQPKHRLFHAPN